MVEAIYPLSIIGGWSLIGGHRRSRCRAVGDVNGVNWMSFWEEALLNHLVCKKLHCFVIQCGHVAYCAPRLDWE